MESTLPTRPPGGLPEELSRAQQLAKEYIQAAKAENTLRAYRQDWADFSAWCEEKGLCPLPAAPEVVASYISVLADGGKKASTIRRRLASISRAHQAAGYASPIQAAAVRETWRGIARKKGTAPQGKAPILVETLRAMVAALPSGMIGIRDRAMLLIGFAGAFRRSELVGLDAEDIEETDDGLVVHLRRSKTDQEGAGRKVGIPFGSDPATCPVRALRAWLEASGIAEGPLFRPVNRHGQVGERRLSDKAVALVVKRAAAAAGYDPARFSGHSLRAGLATAAAAAGKSERAIMEQTGHKSAAMVRRYIRDGSLFRDNAASGIGL